MSHPIIAPVTIPVGIAHQLSLPLEIEAAMPPPINPPASEPSLQLLSSTSTLFSIMVLLGTLGLSLHSYSIVSFHDLT